MNGVHEWLDLVKDALTKSKGLTFAGHAWWREDEDYSTVTNVTYSEEYHKVVDHLADQE